jgi:hypothetical protein
VNPSDDAMVASSGDASADAKAEKAAAAAAAGTEVNRANMVLAMMPSLQQVNKREKTVRRNCIQECTYAYMYMLPNSCFIMTSS